MRLFAFYLPQFHETEENNEWWGKGFTEWTHVNAAKPIFKGHLQPIVPKDKNYYNLMDKKTVEWQTELMKSHGIDGMAYYHYYFCGKKLLNKPAENLLKWTDIDQPFFFCWANHSWYKAVDGVKNLLIEQRYGSKEEWEAHLQYLLPFFKDTRYEKKDNKPVFMIYDGNFPEKQEMLDFFNTRLKEEGFDGIYVIETFSGGTTKQQYIDFKDNLSSVTELAYIRQPSVAVHMEMENVKRSPKRISNKIFRTLSEKGKISWVDKYSGSRLFNIMMKDKYEEDNICHGLFFSWDNTPRHGVRGYIITPPKKEEFFRYARTIKDDEFVFINAWNEWAEGMMLEPTEHEGLKYLSWIKGFKDSLKDEVTE